MASDFAGRVVAVVSGLVAGELLKALERKLAPWRVHDGND